MGSWDWTEGVIRLFETAVREEEADDKIRVMEKVAIDRAVGVYGGDPKRVVRRVMRSGSLLGMVWFYYR